MRAWLMEESEGLSSFFVRFRLRFCRESLF